MTKPKNQKHKTDAPDPALALEAAREHLEAMRRREREARAAWEAAPRPIGGHPAAAITYGLRCAELATLEAEQALEVARRAALAAGVAGEDETDPDAYALEALRHELAPLAALMVDAEEKVRGYQARAEETIARARVAREQKAIGRGPEHPHGPVATVPSRVFHVLAELERQRRAGGARDDRALALAAGWVGMGGGAQIPPGLGGDALADAALRGRAKPAPRHVERVAALRRDLSQMEQEAALAAAAEAERRQREADAARERQAEERAQQEREARRAAERRAELEAFERKQAAERERGRALLTGGTS